MNDKQTDAAIPGSGDEIFTGRRSLFYFFSIPSVLVMVPVTIVVFQAEGFTSVTPWIFFAADVFLFIFGIGLYNPQKNRWALRTSTSCLCLLFLWYFIVKLIDYLSGDEPFWDGMGSASLGNATFTLLVFGIPCLRYALKRKQR